MKSAKKAASASPREQTREQRKSKSPTPLKTTDAEFPAEVPRDPIEFAAMSSDDGQDVAGDEDKFCRGATPERTRADRGFETHEAAGEFATYVKEDDGFRMSGNTVDGCSKMNADDLCTEENYTILHCRPSKFDADGRMTEFHVVDPDDRISVFPWPIALPHPWFFDVQELQCDRNLYKKLY